MQLTLFQLPTRLLHLDAQRAKLTQSSLSPQTIACYASDWRAFEAWASTEGLRALPATAETLERYVTHRLEAGKRITSVNRALWAIYRRHRDEGHPALIDGALDLLTCAQRLLCEKPRQMQPLDVTSLKTISAALRESGETRAIRDRAVLVLGFASALRRSNIAALDLADIQPDARGIVIRVQREKQDQLGKGRAIAIPYGQHPDTCAAGCLADWLRKRGMREGPLFTHLGGKRDGRRLVSPTIGAIVRRRVALAGLDGKDYCGHSLRAGFVTAAGESGLGLLQIAAQTGHRNMAMLQRYFRQRDLWRSNAAGMIGL